MVVLGEGTYGVVRLSRSGDEAIKELRKVSYRETLDESYVRSMSVCSLRRPTEHHLVKCTPISADALVTMMGVSGAYPRLKTLTIRMPRYKRDLHSLISANKSRFYTQMDVQQVLTDVATAVDYLHANWIVHRDIKLQNILVDDRGRAYLGDFDLSHQWNTTNMEKKGYVMDSQCVYTVHYRPPETMLAACEGKKQTIEQQMRGDVWSLGVLALDLIDPALHTLTMWRNAPNVYGDARKMLPQIFRYFGLSADGWLMRHHKETLDKLGCAPCAPQYAVGREWPLKVDERYKHTLCGMLQTDPDRRFSAAQVVLGLGIEPSRREAPVTVALREVVDPPVEMTEKEIQPYAAYYYSIYMHSPPPLRKPPAAKTVAMAAGALAYTYVYGALDDLIAALREAKCGNLIVRTVQLWIIALLGGNLALPDDLVHQITHAQ